MTELGEFEVIVQYIEQVAGKEIMERITEGRESLSEAQDEERAKWVKVVIEKLERLLDKETATKIMVHCGYECAHVNRAAIEEAVAKRQEYESNDKYIKAEIKNPSRGTRLNRYGDILHQYYTPHTFSEGLRCYCGRISSLPHQETLSLLYCYCSKGFVERLWEAVLGDPVEVDIIKSTMSGADECEFVIKQK
ncbi:MAG: DUF6144 family protein [Candidatus Thorarchaeota archaeon]|jgi:predicted hydrocarbon binding protein